jgi:hypothetical protein
VPLPDYEFTLRLKNQMTRAASSCILFSASFSFSQANSMTSKSSTLILYSTPACHLCETALLLMEPYLETLDMEVVEVDISTSDVLMEKYGIRIPVIRFSDGEAELGWPFTEDDFLDFVAR